MNLEANCIIGLSIDMDEISGSEIHAYAYSHWYRCYSRKGSLLKNFLQNLTKKFEM